MFKIPYSERWSPVLRAAVAWIRSRLLIVLSAGIAGGVAWLAKALAGDQIVIEAKRIGAKIPGWASQPIGEFALILVTALAIWIAVWVALAVLVGIWQTRAKKIAPVAEPEKVEPPQLSADETNSIESARVFWREIGKSTSGYVEWSLLRPAQMELGKATQLAGLLCQPLDELTRARESLDYSLNDHAKIPHSEVMGRLLRMFKAYIWAVRYLHECEDAHNIRLDSEPFHGRYPKWQALHERFARDLTALSLRSDYAAIRFEISHEDNWKLRF